MRVPGFCDNQLEEDLSLLGAEFQCPAEWLPGVPPNAADEFGWLVLGVIVW